MYLIFKIRFNPSSFAEFDDELTILMEENIVKIPLLARKEPPNLNLPSVLDCKSCWIGDQRVEVFRVTNTGGEAGYRFFKQNEEPVQSDYIQFENFIISPVEFFLQKGESQEIQVVFRPDREGRIENEVILGCDNQTSASLLLQGGGNMVELGIAAIDENNLEVLQTEEVYQKIFFKNAVPNQRSVRVLKIRNKTSVQVQYHWSLFKNQKELELNDEEFYFSIQPSEGVFQPDEVVSFEVSLKSSLYYPLFEYANLIIDEIPFESIRNPPETLQTQFGSMGEQQGVFGSNSTRPSITYFEFELISFSSLCKASVDQAFYVCPGSLHVGEMLRKKFVVRNHSQCDLQFRVEPAFRSHDQIAALISEESGTIPAQGQKEIELGIQSHVVGVNQKLVYRVDFDYCDSESIEVNHSQFPFLDDGHLPSSPHPHPGAHAQLRPHEGLRQPRTRPPPPQPRPRRVQALHPKPQPERQARLRIRRHPHRPPNHLPPQGRLLLHRPRDLPRLHPTPRRQRPKVFLGGFRRSPGAQCVPQ